MGGHVSKVPATEVPMRSPCHPALAPCPTLVAQRAAIRSSYVHSGLDFIDPDQGLRMPQEGHLRPEAGNGYDGPSDSCDRG